MAAVHRRSPLATFLPGASTPGGLAFHDRTLAPRAGIRGPGTRNWLVAEGYRSPPPANMAVRLPSGLIVAMLGENEALFLDPDGTTPLWSFATGAAFAPGVYPVPRAEGTFWITIAGEAAPAMFALLCGVDLRRKAFPDLRVAQTMIAKAAAVVIRDDAIAGEAFHVLGDISLASYLVRQLVAAAESLSPASGSDR
jgi:sarcosine oxidase subunit gamma